PAMSEPEECWEEMDDEDFDDQDQAYTTAHSVRSRDMTQGGATEIVPLPRVTARVQRELEDAREEVERTRTQDDVEEELWDVSMVAEYGDEIFEYMRELEIKMLPNAHYMDNQTEIQWSMRSVLMDWLVQVHNRFGLLPETLFLTVNYIDRFLSQKIVSIGKLQLVGATAILVASKYEEINCPSLGEIVYMVDNGYTADEVLKAERFMLSMLSFELGWPGPMSFLRRVSKADDYDLETRTLAKYFLELTIMDERFVASPPSFLAAGAHCLSRLILKKGDWTKQHVFYSGYTWSQLKNLVTMMIECCDRPHMHHAAVFEKYTDRRYKSASLLVQEALDLGFTLPHQPTPVREEPDAYRETSAEVSITQPQLIPIEG
ncbi:cyclin B3, partial [Fusarium heterosporum]